jgi:hypothetical protein
MSPTTRPDSNKRVFEKLDQLDTNSAPITLPGITVFELENIETCSTLADQVHSYRHGTQDFAEGST